MGELEIGSDDFRRAWPTALSIAMTEAGRVLAECQTLKNSLDETSEKVIRMAQLAPKMMASGQDKLNEAVERLSERHADLVQAQTTMLLERVSARTNQLLNQMAEAKIDLQSAQVEFIQVVSQRQAEFERSVGEAKKTLEKMQSAQAAFIAANNHPKPKGFWASLFG